uniref:Cysteine-rich membrane protein 2 n=1 Tax=Spironucleus salmonicida TaxID=348837 RepID=V6LSZ3_9EUKA|eukprot:EST47378.1 Hypothetical protein SS50377_12552 [Spironucleus salmonicida]
MAMKSCRMCEKEKCVQCAVGNSVCGVLASAVQDWQRAKSVIAGPNKLAEQLRLRKFMLSMAQWSCAEKGEYSSCAGNPRLCVEKISSNTIICIVMGILGGIALIFGDEVFVIVARKRRFHVNRDYGANILGQSKDSSGQLF